MKREASAAGRWARFCIAALIGLSAPRIVEGACTAPAPDLGQFNPNCNGGYCYVVSPGLHTSETLAGTFWSFGSGNPAVGTGTDSGGWSLGNWLLPEGSKLWLGGNWSASATIDGCIIGTTAPGKPAEIMVTLISDEASGMGFFAVASARRVVNAFPEFDFTFVAGGGLARDINLVEIPRARILSVTRPDTYQFGGVMLSQVSPGIYGDGSLAPQEVAKGYRIYTRLQTPTSLKTSAGWSAISGIVPLDQDVSLNVPCPATTGEFYVGSTLVFDGDFESAHVGRYIRIVCNHCARYDQDGDGWFQFGGLPECCQDPFCDCNDSNPNVHPEALEVCNGIDDNCDGSIDNAILPGSVASLALEKQPGTTRIEWPPLPVATRYDVVRGDLTTLLLTGGSYSAATKACAANNITVARVDDAEDPEPGGYGLWYLIRAANCTGVGSYDTPGASQAAPRDAGIAASGQACP